MATNVNAAFSKFINEEINISKSSSDLAKNCRDYLFNQIHSLSSSGKFVPLASLYDISFGSFSRKTKIYPLDDIDVIVGLDGGKITLHVYNWDNIKLTVDNDSTNNALRNLCDVYNGYAGRRYVINSNKVKNKLVNALSNLNNYSKADLHARGEAVTLNLKSYTWNNIVPAFSCIYYNDNQYYLIPNGRGNWKFTNPKLEQERVSRLNVEFNGVVLSTIRLLKYWKKRGKMPNITSYVLETITLDYFDQAKHSGYNSKGMSYDCPDDHFSGALKYIRDHIFYTIHDSKGVQNDINDLNYSQKMALRNRAGADYDKSIDAITAEIYEKNDKKSINIWRDIFGERFPKYE